MSFEQESNMHAFYVRRYPALRNVLGSVENLFNDCSVLQKQTCEIELRLGSMVNGKFQNGVSEVFFTQAIEMFKTMQLQRVCPPTPRKKNCTVIKNL